MRDIKIEKITLNIGVGGPGKELDAAVKLLNIITGEKPVKTTSKKRIPTWNLRPGLTIATKVTLRKEKAIEVLKRLLVAKGGKLNEKNFDDHGNFSFGIAEYLDIPGVEYDAEIGIIGLEVAVTLMRPGFRIKRRKLRIKKIPARHRIVKDEAIKFMNEKFGIEVEK